MILSCTNYELAASFHWTADLSELLFTLAIALLTLVGDLNGSGLFAFKAVSCATAATAAILQDCFIFRPCLLHIGGGRREMFMVP